MMVISQIKDNSTFVSERSKKYATQWKSSDWWPATLQSSRQLFLSLWVAAHYQEEANRDYCEINQSEASMRLVPFLVLENFSCTSFRAEYRFTDKKVTSNNDFSFK